MKSNRNASLYKTATGRLCISKAITNIILLFFNKYSFIPSWNISSSFVYLFVYVTDISTPPFHDMKKKTKKEKLSSLFNVNMWNHLFECTRWYQRDESLMFIYYSSHGKQPRETVVRDENVMWYNMVQEQNKMLKKSDKSLTKIKQRKIQQKNIFFSDQKYL